MKKKPSARRPSQRALKTLHIGIRLDGDILVSSAGIERNSSRDGWIQRYFAERAGQVTTVSEEELEHLGSSFGPPIDVLITHVPPSSELPVREMCEELQEQGLLSVETFVFMEYGATLGTLRTIAQRGVPIIAYTGAAEASREVFARTGYFKAVIAKGARFEPDCRELAKACRRWAPRQP